MDVNDLQARVEVAMETLLRSADARVNWKEQQLEGSANGSPYTFLPGVYRTSCTDTDDTIESGDKSVVDSECGCYSILLHGDNTFEYTWTMHRQAPRAMEYTVEITGDWVKPVLNRSRRGEEDHRIFLTSKRIRFQRLSNYDTENQTWKLCLKTLTRQGSEWAQVGEIDRGIPPIVMTFDCTSDGVLESTGSVLPSQVLSNSPACRVLAGLTKKIANKLGGPIDVMTEKWLPSRNSKVLLVRSENTLIKKFNPFYCLAEALRGTNDVSQRVA